jgi:DMSO/TMAO reductase YedYZ heme-binding membrane subunit
MPNRWPMYLGLLLGLAAMVAGLQAAADHTESWLLAARWTARVGFPIFLIAYSASALLRLWPSDLTKALVRKRRWWGLGFAASHTVHLYALVTYNMLLDHTPSVSTLIGGGGAYAILYVMAFTSNNAAMRVLGVNWKRIHTLGIHWLWFIFAFSYFGRVMSGKEMPYSAITLSLAIVALGLRIAAWQKARARRRAAA